MSAKLKEPNMYAIVLEDNDNLTIQFVKDILSEVFKKEDSVCEEGIISLKRDGYIEVARLPLQFAEQKQTEVTLVAKLAGIPFNCAINKV